MIGRSAPPLLAAALLASCANGSGPLYHWGGYEEMLASMAEVDRRVAPAEQVAILTEQLARAAAVRKPAPPGLWAHLGWARSETGDLAGARAAFRREAAIFPEARPFVETMLARLDER